MRRAFIATLCVMLLTGLSSCVKDVIMDAKEKPQVAVACILTDDPEQTMLLSFTKGASLSEAPPLTEAVVTLFDGEEEVGKFNHKQANEWTLSYSAVPLHHYRIEVQVPGYDLIWAEQTMPEPVKLYSGICNRFHPYLWPWAGWVTYYGPEGTIGNSWPEEEDFPECESLYYLRGSENSSPFWICGVNYDNNTGNREIASEICVDENRLIQVDDFNLTGNFYDSPVKDVPIPYQLWANQAGVTDDIIKSFQTAHLLKLYPDLVGSPIHDRYLRFNAFKNPKYEITFYISGNFTGEYYVPEIDPEENWYYTDYFHPTEVEDGLDRWGELLDDSGNKGFILCTTTSDDYDKYLIESYRHMQIKASTDLSTIYLRDNIFTNIHGGIGIFGAAVIRRYPWLATYTYSDTGLKGGYGGLSF